MGISTQIIEVCVPSGIFCYRNYKKAENGEKARGSVAFAQGAKIVEAITKYNDSTAKTANEALNIYKKYAEKSKIVDYAGKSVNWATHNVNTLICLSGAIKVLNSDDKVHTGITEGGALAGMFTGEGLMKLGLDKIYNAQNVETLASKLKNVPGLTKLMTKIAEGKGSSKIAALAKVLTFVCGSLMSYNVGKVLGENAADRLCTDAGIGYKKTTQKIDQKA